VARQRRCRAVPPQCARGAMDRCVRGAPPWATNPGITATRSGLRAARSRDHGQHERIAGRDQRTVCLTDPEITPMRNGDHRHQERIAAREERTVCPASLEIMVVIPGDHGHTDCTGRAGEADRGRHEARSLATWCTPAGHTIHVRSPHDPHVARRQPCSMGTPCMFGGHQEKVRRGPSLLLVAMQATSRGAKRGDHARRNRLVGREGWIVCPSKPCRPATPSAFPGSEVEECGCETVDRGRRNRPCGACGTPCRRCGAFLRGSAPPRRRTTTRLSAIRRGAAPPGVGELARHAFAGALDFSEMREGGAGG
jgi:hypothetical protein